LVCLQSEFVPEDVAIRLLGTQRIAARCAQLVKESMATSVNGSRLLVAILVFYVLANHSHYIQAQTECS
jgi:hypothetical protein